MMRLRRLFREGLAKMCENKRGGGGAEVERAAYNKQHKPLTKATDIFMPD